jgi:NADH:ubiquinone oxidoreductase subunit K
MLASSAGIGIGEAFLVLAFSTDTAISAIVLALLVLVHKKYGVSDISELVKIENLKEESEVEE